MNNSAIEHYVSYLKKQMKYCEGIDEKSCDLSVSIDIKSLPKPNFPYNILKQEFPNDLKEFIEKIDKEKRLIYKMSLETSIENKQILKAAECIKKSRAVSRRNKDEDSKDNVLYIGSKQKNFEQRLKEHLGYGSKSTYALQLVHWRDKISSDFIIKIELYYYDELPYMMLKNIEHALWYHYKPILGQGGLDLNLDK